MSRNRRLFLKTFARGLLATGSLPSILNATKSEEIISKTFKPTYGPNDKIRFATIGMGIMGFNNTNTALKIDGTELVGVCDLYKGRLKRAKEVYGKSIFTTYDFKEVIERSDVDVVIVTTSDHWHDHITIEALKAGKAVYCEKPMS